MKKLEWTTTQRKVNDLLEQEINPRKITDAERQRLIASLEKFNLADIPLINYDSSIISGHQRVAVLKMLGRGEELIDVRTPNRELTLAEVKEYMLIANTHSGVFDLDILQLEFADIDMEIAGINLKQIEFESSDAFDKQMDTFFKRKEAKELKAEEDDYQIPERIQTDTVIGDLFTIGPHRLLCGDSTDSDAVAKLMDGEKADMLVTDPPYGVNYDPKWRDGLEHQKNGTANGDKVINDDNADWSIVYALFNANVIYVWHSSIKTHVFADSIIKAGYVLTYLIIWNKDLMILGRGDYHHKFEPCWYAVKDGMPHNYNGDRQQTTVWDIPAIHSFKNGKNKEDWNLVGHSCQKPIDCMSIPIKNNSKENQIIADPFLGSGSTMVAAHQLGRKCYGLELDPHYCQVIIERMVKLDSTLTLTRNGQPWKLPQSI